MSLDQQLNQQFNQAFNQPLTQPLAQTDQLNLTNLLNRQATFPKQLYGVIGYPLSQSLSPFVHNLGLQNLDLAASYFLWPVAPENLAKFIDACRLLPISGLSITIPHKIAVIPLLDELTEIAKATQAVNTLFWQNGKLCGDNTDLLGFLSPLTRLNLDKNLPILILGAGGAAAASANALFLNAYSNITISNHTESKAKILAEKFSFKTITWDKRHNLEVALVINTTPLGMHGELEKSLAYDARLGKKAIERPFAYDLVYNPLETQFLAVARKANWQIISGAEMFFAQANAQFQIWTGQNLPELAKIALVQKLQQK